MRIVTDSGMVVDRRGAGPAVLLIHGVGGPLMWEKLMPMLARSRDGVLPHLRGFGDSPAPEGTMSSTATFVAASGPLFVSVMRKLILSPTFGVGSSTVFSRARSAT